METYLLTSSVLVFRFRSASQAVFLFLCVFKRFPGFAGLGGGVCFFGFFKFRGFLGLRVVLISIILDVFVMVFRRFLVFVLLV